jgi:hypothetical protein
LTNAIRTAKPAAGRNGISVSALVRSGAKLDASSEKKVRTRTTWLSRVIITSTGTGPPAAEEHEDQDRHDLGDRDDPVDGRRFLDPVRHVADAGTGPVAERAEEPRYSPKPALA